MKRPSRTTALFALLAITVVGSLGQIGPGCEPGAQGPKGETGLPGATGTSGSVTLSVGNGAITSSHLASNSVTSSKIQNSAVTNTKLQNSSVSTSKIQSEAVTFDKLDDPMNLGSNVWDWDFTSGNLDIDKSSDFIAVDITNSSSSSDGDGLWVRSTLSSASVGTWALYARTERGNTAYFRKNIDDNKYAVVIDAVDEGLLVSGDFLAVNGTKSAGVITPGNKC